MRLDDEEVVFKVFNSLKHPSNFDTCKYISTVNSFAPFNSLVVQEISLEDTVKKRDKTKKENTTEAPARKKKQPLGKSKESLKDTGQKGMLSKLVKVWRRKQEYNASTLKNCKCDTHGS